MFPRIDSNSNIFDWQVELRSGQFDVNINLVSIHLFTILARSVSKLWHWRNWTSTQWSLLQLLSPFTLYWSSFILVSLVLVKEINYTVREELMKNTARIWWKWRNGVSAKHEWSFLPLLSNTSGIFYYSSRT